MVVKFFLLSFVNIIGHLQITHNYVFNKTLCISRKSYSINNFNHISESNLYILPKTYIISYDYNFKYFQYLF